MYNDIKYCCKLQYFSQKKVKNTQFRNSRKTNWVEFRNPLRRSTEDISQKSGNGTRTQSGVWSNKLGKLRVRTCKKRWQHKSK